MRIGKGRKPNEVAAREDAGTVVHVKDESGAKAYYTDGSGADRPVTIKIAGSYSARARRAQEASRDQMFKLRGVPDGDDATVLALGVLVASILEWDGVFDDNDNPLLLTPDNAFVVLRDMPWVRDQLEAAHNNHAAFFKPS
jgi:hypothetical protein